MYHLLLIVVPVACYAFGFLPDAAVYALAPIMFFYSSVRYFLFAMLLSGRIQIAPASSIDAVKEQAVVSLAMLASLAVFWHADFMFMFWFAGIITPPSLFCQWRTALLTLASHKVAEDA